MIRIVRDYADPDDGFLFWKGETFAAMSGPPYADGVEVKTAGEYVWIPADVFEVID